MYANEWQRGTKIMVLNNIDIPSMIPTLGHNLETLESPMLQRSVTVHDGPTAFEHFLQAAMDVVDEANVRLIESDVAQTRFATGQCNDMLTVILAQERASSALNFTVQVSNRIIEAYREIMRMQL